MKRIISILTVIVMFAISCMTTTMASFSVPELKVEVKNSMEMDIWMQHESMNNSDCCDVMTWDCEESAHECCYSPFKDSSIVSWTSNNQNDNKKLKVKVSNIDILALVQESLEYNYNEKLTSPPDWIIWKTDNNIFVELTWIIKNNC